MSKFRATINTISAEATTPQAAAGAALSAYLEHAFSVNGKDAGSIRVKIHTPIIIPLGDLTIIPVYSPEQIEAQRKKLERMGVSMSNTPAANYTTTWATPAPPRIMFAEPEPQAYPADVIPGDEKGEDGEAVQAQSAMAPMDIEALNPGPHNEVEKRMLAEKKAGRK